jgi:hypothetical protein
MVVRIVRSRTYEGLYTAQRLLAGDTLRSAESSAFIIISISYLMKRLMVLSSNEISSDICA